MNYNPLPRLVTSSQTVELFTPYFDEGYTAIAADPRAVGRLKEYKFLYSANSYLFEGIAHLLTIATSEGLSPVVVSGLIATLGLFSGVFNLLEKRR